MKIVNTEWDPHKKDQMIMKLKIKRTTRKTSDGQLFGFWVFRTRLLFVLHETSDTQYRFNVDLLSTYHVSSAYFCFQEFYNGRY